jgi:hypothetical protein
LALASAGHNKAARMPMMATTTNNSIKVKARQTSFLAGAGELKHFCVRFFMSVRSPEPRGRIDCTL